MDEGRYLSLKSHCPFRKYAIAGLGALVILAAFLGCSRDADYKRVDFSQKAEVGALEPPPADRQLLRVAVAAMISPRETSIYYRELIDYIGARIGHDIELVQRKTYGEVNELLTKGHIELAFICTGPYVFGADAYGIEAVATPIIRESPFYQSYLIVHRESPLQSLSDLKGKIFAFTDPESNSGSLVPRYWLKQMGQKPETFFGGVTYTYSHDNSIMAVAKRLVDGAAVDGHMWEYYQQRNAFYSSKTRVIHKSEPFGSPPLVVSKALNPQLKASIVDIVMSMHADPEGRRILDELLIDRFSAPRPEWYRPVKEMLERMAGDEERHGVSQKS